MLNYMFENEAKNTILYKEKEMITYPSQNCLDVLDDLCKKFGSTYRGRRGAVASHLKIRQKVPVVVCEKEPMMLFPTVSVKRKDCIWINYYSLKKVKKINHQTLFVFQNGKELLVDIEIRSALLQIRRCTIFLICMNYSINNQLNYRMRSARAKKQFT